MPAISVLAWTEKIENLPLINLFRGGIVYVNMILVYNMICYIHVYNVPLTVTSIQPSTPSDHCPPVITQAQPPLFISSLHHHLPHGQLVDPHDSPLDMLFFVQCTCVLS